MEYAYEKSFFLNSVEQSLRIYLPSPCAQSKQSLQSKSATGKAASNKQYHKDHYSQIKESLPNQKMLTVSRPSDNMKGTLPSPKQKKPNRSNCKISVVYGKKG